MQTKGEVWLKVLSNIMRNNCYLNYPNIMDGVTDCIRVADEVVKEYEKRFVEGMEGD